MWAGLGSTATWRRESNDASFAARRTCTTCGPPSAPGTFADAGTLTGAAAGHRARRVDRGCGRTARRRHPGRRHRPRPRRSWSPAGSSACRSTPMPPVDGVWIRDGAAPAGGPDASGSDAVLEAKFADFYDLPPDGTVTVAGGTEVDYGGLGVAPEDFFVDRTRGHDLRPGRAGDPLRAAGDGTGRWPTERGMVNDLVLTLTDRRRPRRGRARARRRHGGVGGHHGDGLESGRRRGLPRPVRGHRERPAVLERDRRPWCCSPPPSPPPT